MTKNNNRSRRPTRNTGKLKMWLLASSLVATLGGTHLLDKQNAHQAVAAAFNNEPTSVIEAETGVIELQPVPTAIPLPSSSRKIEVTLPRIPQIMQLRPIARSRSSR